jgi:hypothetical protein
MSANREMTAMTNSVNYATQGVKSVNNAAQQMNQGASNLVNNLIVSANKNAMNATNQLQNASRMFNKAANNLNAYKKRQNANYGAVQRVFKEAAESAEKAHLIHAVAKAIEGVRIMGANAATNFPAVPTTPNRA